MKLFFGLCLLLSLCGAGTAGADDRFDLLVSLLNDASPTSKSLSGADAYVGAVIENDWVATQSFKKYGDAFRFYSTPEPPYSCLLDGSCFWNHVLLLEKKQREEFLPKDFQAAAEDRRYLRDFVASDKLEQEVLARLSKFAKEVVDVKKVTRVGDPQAKHEVWIFRNGHPAEQLQEQTIQQLLRRYPTEFRFVYVEKKDYPKLFSLIGKRWYSAALYQDKLLKSFSSPDQWTEFFFGKVGEFGSEEQFKKISLFDAHEHITSSGRQRWPEIVRDNHLVYSVNLALPSDIHYAGLAEANEAVLSFAQEHPHTTLPFVILAPNDPADLGLFKKYQKQGNRGLKLMNGHGDYFVKNQQSIIDTPELREVFRYCEKEGIPVLWHVNSHLYMRGLFRALEEFPKLKIVNPHFGGYLTDAPNVVRELLRKYPNLYLDISFGVQSLYLRRSLEDISLRSDAWRKVFVDFPDRFMFGTDMVVTDETSRSHAKMLYALYRGLLEKKSYTLDFFSARGYSNFLENSHYHKNLNGLHLPDRVLKKIYWENPLKVYGEPK